MNEQSQRELMIKAAVKFKGKWPEGATHIYRLGEKITAAKDNGDLNPIEVPTPSNIHTFLMVGVDAWQPLCNQQEFEAFMQELADKAPEGATHYLPTTTFNKYWVKDSSGFRPISEIQGKPIAGPICQLNEVDLIPLPKREAALWTPEVGQECEAVDYTCGNEEYYQQVRFIGDNPLDKSDNSFKAFSCVDGGDLFWSDKFRSLRTEAEIERQALYDSLCELDADLDDYQINCLIEFIQGRNDD